MCILWINQIGTNKYICTKYRLCKRDPAQFFLDATIFFQDEVHSRAEDLISVYVITAADLFYHKKRYAKYSCKYERAKNGNCNVKGNVETKTANKKEQLFCVALEELETQSSPDIASIINNVNTLKSDGESLKRAMQTVNFGLDDIFCDAENLKRSWKNTIISSEWMIFYSGLFNIKRITMDQKQTPCTNTTEKIEDVAN